MTIEDWPITRMDRSVRPLKGFTCCDGRQAASLAVAMNVLHRLKLGLAVEVDLAFFDTLARSVLLIRLFSWRHHDERIICCSLRSTDRLGPLTSLPDRPLLEVTNRLKLLKRRLAMHFRIRLLLLQASCRKFDANSTLISVAAR